MATAPAATLTIGPGDAGRRMTLDEFIAAEGLEGYLYELARGVVVVTEVPLPPHGMIVRAFVRLFVLYDVAHPGIIRFAGGGAECRIRLPDAVSDRHPDQAIYLSPMPRGKRVWDRWVPAIVVEVVSRRGEERDYVQKRDEYLRFGVLEYWIFDPYRRTMTVLLRLGDTWEGRTLHEGDVHRTDLLPGLEVHVGAILGPPIAVEDGDDGDVEVEPPPAV